MKRKARRKLIRRVCLPVTAERLKTSAYYSLSGDRLAPPGFHHRGDPDAVDPCKMTKRQVYEAAVSGDMAFFEKLAVAWNADRWHEFTISRRTYQSKDGKLRPIDLSSEYRRLLCLWVRGHLQRLVDDAKYLLPTIIGFRHIREFEDYRDREDGITIQDVFASTVWRLIHQYGPWVVLLDQQDAFGNLPHEAIHAALMELGVPRRDRRAIIELVRVRTVKSDGNLLKPKGYGIEQGNYLAPLVFNIVQSFLAQRLPVPMACYGDDLVLVAPTEGDSRQAFDAYKQLTDPYGYKNTRGLNDPDEKHTRIIDTQSDKPLRLIKTYELGRGRIGLTKKKAHKLPANATLADLRRANRWKVVSKSYLQTLVVGLSGGVVGVAPSSRSPATEGGVPSHDGSKSNPESGTIPSCLQKGMEPVVGKEMDGPTGDTPSRQDDRSTPVGDGPPCRSMEAVGALEPTLGVSSPLMCNSTAVVVAANTKAPGFDGGRQAGDAENGRSAASRGGSGVGVTADHNGREGSGHRPSLPDTVLLIRDADIEALAAGRRLRAGDHNRGVIIDCRELVHRIPASRMAHAVQQLCRVGSLHGRVHLLVHPGDDWVNRGDILAGVHVKGSYERAEGIVLRLIRHTALRPQDPRPRRPDTPPPTADLIVRTVRRHRDHATGWTVEVENGKGREVLHVRATSPNHGIGRAEAIAVVLDHYNPGTVALRATGQLRQLLDEGPVRVRQMGLADAIATIRNWEWMAEGAWLVGC